MNRPLKKLSVLVPCFNEEGNVARYEEELIRPLRGTAEDLEFVFIDDGSRDSTREGLKRLSSRFSAITLITHDRNLGMGSSLRDGIKASTGDAVLILDGDLTFHPDQVRRLVSVYQNENVDVVLGSPVAGRFEKVGMIRRILSRSVNALYRWLLGVPITSMSSLFRLYRADRIRNKTFRSRHFSINAEIMFELIRNGATFKEVPVTLAARTWGRSKINSGREIVNHLGLFWTIFRWRIGV